MLTEYQKKRYQGDLYKKLMILDTFRKAKATDCRKRFGSCIGCKHHNTTEGCEHPIFIEMLEG